MTKVSVKRRGLLAFDIIEMKESEFMVHTPHPHMNEWPGYSVILAICPKAKLKTSVNDHEMKKVDDQMLGEDYDWGFDDALEEENDVENVVSNMQSSAQFTNNETREG